MATSREFMEFVLEQISSMPTVRARKMFGEYALYCDDKVVGLVCDEQVFIKITPEGRALVGDRYEEGLPYPGAKPWMLVDGDEIEESDRMCSLIRATADALPSPAPKRPRTR
ncbi:MAG TPA: TfoX/Sxy family protein [Myxococcota bacterium]|nr:TfoX/Sxy family protein [Myxococcota bacterium]HOD00695.1 TfoX/Sxy family protein [Myxococcota bacterium]HOH76067.1 TfoX/Sxy family protein [Myxococcota bacterium]HPV03903.1 TfoX/Sxy family protein [Myxococcota bacterium]